MSLTLLTDFREHVVKPSPSNQSLGDSMSCFDLSVAVFFWQNNEPLMRALSKLINDNEPDLVLFVGEALVGNDGVNQLQMFNQV